MKTKPLFGEWFSTPAEGIAIKLVIEQMSDAAKTASATDAVLVTDSAESPRVSFSSGSNDFPWQAQFGDEAPSITWTFSKSVMFLSLKVQQTSSEEWIRRYRIEISPDGTTWNEHIPSRLIDRHHRQPSRLANYVNSLTGSLLPMGDGTQWTKVLFEDYMLRALYPLGPKSAYSDWVPGTHFIAAAAEPFPFEGVYASECPNFNALIAAILNPEMSTETQRLFPALIDRFDFLPGVMGSGHKDDKAFTLDYTQMIWGSCCYKDLYAWTGDRDFLKWFSDACAKWARWWLDNRDTNGDGWIEPGMNSFKPASDNFKKENAKKNPELAKLCPEFWDYVGVHNPNQSAMLMMICELPSDDFPIYVRGRHRGLKFIPETRSCNIHYIESQLYLSMMCDFVAYAYTTLGRSSEATYFHDNAERLKALVRDNCWDEKSGFYYDCDIDSGKRRTFVKHVGAFVPMLMGIPTPAQAKRMLEHLTNPDEFWTVYPVPTISKDSPDYSPTHYWSGQAWPPTNFFVLRALLNYGFFDTADELLRRWLAHTQTCMNPSPKMSCAQDISLQLCDDVRDVDVPDVEIIVPENWNPETGEVRGSGGLTWGGLWLPALIMRYFWPVGKTQALLRGGGKFHLTWGKRWDVSIDGMVATINGKHFQLAKSTTFLVNVRTGKLTPLEPGKADPVCLAEK